MISDMQQLPAPTAAFAAGTESAAIVNVIDPGIGGGQNYPQGRVLRGYVNVTVGAAGTAFTLKVRQGNGVAGTQVGTTDTLTIAAAGSPMSVPFQKTDFSATTVTAYTLTITGVGGTATVNDGCLEFMVPAPYGAPE